MPDSDPVRDGNEITQLLYLYARAIDGKDFDLLAKVFTEDAVIRYEVAGGTTQPFPEMVEWTTESVASA